MNGRTDAERIVDMVHYGQEAMATLGNASYTELCADRQLQLAIFYLVAVVGEAASKTDPATLRQYRGIPWHQARGARNHLAHDYYALDMWTVYRIVVVYLPQLIAALETTTNNQQPVRRVKHERCHRLRPRRIWTGGRRP